MIIYEKPMAMAESLDYQDLQDKTKRFGRTDVVGILQKSRGGIYRTPVYAADYLSMIIDDYENETGMEWIDVLTPQELDRQYPAGVPAVNL